MLRRVLLAAACVLTLLGPAKADNYVRGYWRQNGTYVQPYYRTQADGYFYNNYTTRPNFNPYTGQQGTRVNPPPYYRGTYYPPGYFYGR